MTALNNLASGTDTDLVHEILQAMEKMNFNEVARLVSLSNPSPSTTETVIAAWAINPRVSDMGTEVLCWFIRTIRDLEPGSERALLLSAPLVDAVTRHFGWTQVLFNEVAPAALRQLGTPALASLIEVSEPFGPALTFAVPYLTDQTCYGEAFRQLKAAGSCVRSHDWPELLPARVEEALEAGPLNFAAFAAAYTASEGSLDWLHQRHFRGSIAREVLTRASAPDGGAFLTALVAALPQWIPTMSGERLYDLITGDHRFASVLLAHCTPSAFALERAEELMDKRDQAARPFAAWLAAWRACRALSEAAPRADVQPL